MSFCSTQPPTLTSQVRATKNSELPVLTGVGSGESNKDEGLVVCQCFFLLSIKREFGIAGSTFVSDSANAGTCSETNPWHGKTVMNNSTEAECQSLLAVCAVNR